MEPPSEAPQPLRILSLDGGGIRGISSLLILENLMEETRKAEGLDHVPRPCDRFDFIGGTSTGGIIAIMLGRLCMTVDECIREYRDVAQKAFTPKRTTFLPASPKGAFSAKALEEAICITSKKFCTEAECKNRRREGNSTNVTCSHAMEFRDAACTKTAVLAITKDNVDAPPTVFTTYDESAAFHGCTIWQVARATSAATTFFKPIRVGRDGIEFVDAGFGYNNPCEILIDEARRQFPSRPHIQVLSIGTGLGDVVSISNTRMGIVKALKKMATSSKKVTARMDEQYGQIGQYFRFNVAKGLEDVTLSDWERSSTISAHTKNYIQENRREIGRFIDHFTDHIGVQLVPAIARPDEQSIAQTSNGPLRFIPLPKNKRFVGREETLETLKTMMFERKCQKVALCGLGGIGKTQVALKLAYSTIEEKPDYSVLWVPASSTETFNEAYLAVAKKLGVHVTDNEDPREALRQHLSSSNSGKWLLVIDNADDEHVLYGSRDESKGIHDYLPESEHGVILFTTRFSRVATSVAINDVVELKQMSQKEASSFLKHSLLKDLHEEGPVVEALLEDLTHLPIAIGQAAAYMNTNRIPVREYVRIFRNTKQDMTELLKSEFHDSTRYKNSQDPVATTWFLSFQKISDTNPRSAELLMFLSCIEPKGIPRSILPTLPSEQQMTEAIGTLCGYAFLTRRGDSNIYDMHRLVHMATEMWIESEGKSIATLKDAVLHITKVFPSDEHKNRHLWKEYMPHAFRLLDNRLVDKEATLELGFWAARCLLADARAKDAIKLLEHIVEVKEVTLDERHPSRLASQHELARAYQADGRVKDAIKLLEHIVEVKEVTLDERHPSRLASQHELASAYHADGRVRDAMKLLEHIVEVHEVTLDERHPDRLASQHELARAYQADGRVKDAIKLLEYVVEVQEATLDERHPNLLTSQHELARAYHADGRVRDAIKLLVHVVEIQEVTLDERHPDRLTSQHELARVYHADGRVKDAIKLLEHVVEIQEVTLDERHPDRLTSQHELARAYKAVR